MKNKTLAAVLLASAFIITPAFAETPVASVESPAPPAISVLKAERKPISQFLSVTGSFAAGEMVLVTPEIEGLAVTEILAEEGDTVTKGQVLARLSDKKINIQIEQTKASLAKNSALVAQSESQIEQAQISVNKAQDDLSRTRKLRASGLSTQEVLDQRQAAYDTAVAQLKTAELGLEVTKSDKAGIMAQMDDLLLSKERTEIKSPFAGYISERTAQIGGIASGSKSPLYSIVMDSIIKLVAEVPEADLAKIKLGQKAKVTVNGFDKPIDGEVKLISPMVNEQTRIGAVHVKLADGVRVPLGAFGRAEVALAAGEGIVIPLNAVTFSDDGPTVQIVKDGKINVQKITTGIVSASEIEVTDGVAEGDVFVARAGTFVRDGDQVTPVFAQVGGQ